MQLSKKTIGIIGRTGSVLAIIMFLSNLDQARLNLQGSKGSIILPIATFFNCILWTIYAQQRKDRPLMICNAVGIFASLASIITYFL